MYYILRFGYDIMHACYYHYYYYYCRCWVLRRPYRGRTGIIYGRRDIMSSRYVLHSFFIHKYEYTRINTKILLLYYYNVMYGQISFV